jgi:hypothetical protein
MYDYDPNYYIADGCQNHNILAMAPHRDPHNYGEPKRPPFVPYGPKPPICPCHYHGEPEKLPPIKRPDHDDKYYEHPPYIPSAKGCNCKIPDRMPVSNIINVESQLLITLKITLYGVKEEDDKTIILENGKEYIITYITEDGVRQITGILRYIDYNIPTECVRYIGEYNTVTDQSYIIIDGSTAGYSNIVKIFIRSLRDIIEVKKDDNKDPDDTNKGDNPDNSPSGDGKDPDTDKGDGSGDAPSGGDKDPGDKGDNPNNPPSSDNKDQDGTDKGDGSDNPSSGEDKGNSGSDSKDEGKTDPPSESGKEDKDANKDSSSSESSGSDSGNKDENKNPDGTESKDDSKSNIANTETLENKDNSSENSNN